MEMRLVQPLPPAAQRISPHCKPDATNSRGLGPPCAAIGLFWPRPRRPRTASCLPSQLRSQLGKSQATKTLTCLLMPGHTGVPQPPAPRQPPPRLLTGLPLARALCVGLNQGRSLGRAPTTSRTYLLYYWAAGLSTCCRDGRVLQAPFFGTVSVEGSANSYDGGGETLYEGTAMSTRQLAQTTEPGERAPWSRETVVATFSCLPKLNGCTKGHSSTVAMWAKTNTRAKHVAPTSRGARRQKSCSTAIRERCCRTMSPAPFAVLRSGAPRVLITNRHPSDGRWGGGGPPPR